MKKLWMLTLLFSVANMAMAQQDMDAMMKAWQAYMTPGDMQQMLARDNGKWSEEVTSWMDPAAPPSKFTAVAENRMIMGGRYQESRHTGEFMGMPFEGLGITGFDNKRKVFQSSWVDNMGTGVMYLEGPYDPATRTVTLKGFSTDPATGEKMMVRQTLKMLDENNQLMEMFMEMGGKETKTMEIKLKRM